MPFVTTFAIAEDGNGVPRQLEPLRRYALKKRALALGIGSAREHLETDGVSELMTVHPKWPLHLRESGKNSPNFLATKTGP